MEKYRNAKNPPSIYTELKMWSIIYIIDLICLGLGIYVAKQVNAMFSLNIVMAIINYIFTLVCVIALIYKPRSNPEERNIKRVIYAIVMDRNNYHSM